MATARHYLRRTGIGITVTAVAGIAVGLIGATAAVAAPAEGEIMAANAPGAIDDRYIVTLKDGAADAGQVSRAARKLSTRFGGSVDKEYSTAVKGFAVRMSGKAARRLAADPAVDGVEQDRAVRLSATQTDATWGLDRIDQRAVPLAGTYTYPNTAANVTAYVLDTGVRSSHQQFGGRARSGWDFVDNDADASDCQGHGTHVAGTVAGSTYGVAKAAKVVSVRVLDCQGSAPYSTIIGGVDWVTKNAVKPAVANMSLGGTASATLDTAVKASIAAGVTYTVAAGNSNVNACNVSPARLAQAITVGATDRNDVRAQFSNYGACLDLFAPGVSITSATKDGDGAVGLMSGTSMAAPHVAGAAAVYLSANPTATPTQVHDALVAAATTAMVTNPGSSPNRLLYLTPAAGTPVVAAPVRCSVTNSVNHTIADQRIVDSKLTVAGCAGTPSASSRVTVDVKHGDRGDLAVRIIAPDGTPRLLKAAVTGDDVVNLAVTYVVDLSTEQRDGTWTLRVGDTFAGDSGYLDGWTLAL